MALMQKTTQGHKQLDALMAGMGERQRQLGDVYRNLDMGLVERRDQAVITQPNASRLDKAIAYYKQEEQTLADLAAGITQELESYTDALNTSKTFSGVKEKTFAFLGDKLGQQWATSVASKWRRQRVKKQKLEDSFKQILNNGVAVTDYIMGGVQEAQKAYDRLDEEVIENASKLAENERSQADLKVKLDAVQGEYDVKQHELEGADAQRRAQIEVEMQPIYKILTEVQSQYNVVSTRYKVENETMEGNKQARKNMDTMIQNMIRMATLIDEKLDRVKDVYVAAATSVRVGTAVKGGEQMDTAINVGYTKSLQIIEEMTEGTTDSVLRREEKEIIDAPVFAELHGRVQKAYADMVARREQIATRAAMSPAERYGLPQQ